MDAKRTLLSLDLSTTCTGFSIFDVESGSLVRYGSIKPSTKGGVAKMIYPKQQLTKMVDIANQLLTLIEGVKPTHIVIEEIAGSKNRLGQKTLDGLHFVVALVLEEYLSIVKYYDVSGAVGWRKHLEIRLSDADKAANKEARTLNKRLARAQQLPITSWKHLSCRYANQKFGTAFDFEQRETDADMADSICMGYAFLTFTLRKS